MSDLPTLHARLGGDVAVRALVDAFYDRMDTWEGAAHIRAMHPADLSTSRGKLDDFLCGWLGGPPRYVAKHGHPRLRARHLPFPIDVAARDQWVACMDHALRATVADEELRGMIGGALARLADHMRNQPEAGGGVAEGAG